MTAADAKTVLRAAYMDAHKGQEPAQELRAEVDALIAAVEAGELDRAWAEAEAALPEGDGTWRGGKWVIHAVSQRPGLGPDERWEAAAWGHASGARVYVYGPTPAAALQALAERLRAPRSGQQSASPIPTPGREAAARFEAPVGTGSASGGRDTAAPASPPLAGAPTLGL